MFLVFVNQKQFVAMCNVVLQTFKSSFFEHSQKWKMSFPNTLPCVLRKIDRGE